MASFAATFGSALTASVTTPRQRRSKYGLAGSARIDTIGERQSTAGTNPSKQGLPQREWQLRAWSFYDDIGELHYTMNFIGACLSRCRLTVGVQDSNGKIGPVFDEDGEVLKDDEDNARPELNQATEAQELLDKLQGTVNGQSGMLRQMGINIGVAGEVHLVGSAQGTAVWDNQGDYEVPTLGDMVWEVLSTEEFRPSGQDYRRWTQLGATPIEIPGDAVHAIRIWRSHPRYVEWPDSSIRPTLEILEELSLLTRQVRAETVSRVANTKLLLIPEEIESDIDEADDQGDNDDPLTIDLIKTMTTAIADKESAAAVAPFVIRAPGDYFHPDKFRVIDLAPTNTSDSQQKREEAVTRFAQGVDLPVEIVTGHANTTFTNAVVIDDSLYKSHIEPILEIICEALTLGYLQPALAEGTQLVVTADATELVTRPNQSGDAKDLHDRWALSDAALRRVNGFSDGDAPDDDELEKRIRVKQLTQVRQTVAALPQQLEGEDVGIGTDTGLPPKGMLDQPVTPIAPPANGNGKAPTPGTPGAPLQPAAATSSDIAFAAEVAIERAVRRAGARLRSKAQKDATLRSMLGQVSDDEVAATFGPQIVRNLVANETELIDGEFDVLYQLIKRKTGDPVLARRMRDMCVKVTVEKLYKPREPVSVLAAND